MNIDIEPEKFVNPKVEGKTTTNDLYHDLEMYLNEMLVEIPVEEDKEMIFKNISTYYDSLNALLFKHTIEHPDKSKS